MSRSTLRLDIMIALVAVALVAVFAIADKVRIIV